MNDIREGDNYEILPEKAWACFTDWYGADFEIMINETENIQI